jgi:hypothetical protein
MDDTFLLDVGAPDDVPSQVTVYFWRWEAAVARSTGAPPDFAGCADVVDVVDVVDATGEDSASATAEA